MNQVGRIGGRVYYTHTYRGGDESIEVPFDGLGFVCLIHRTGSKVSPVEIEDLTRRLLAQNLRAVFCVGEGAQTMRTLIRAVIEKEGWEEELGEEILVSWSATDIVQRNAADLQFIEASVGNTTRYALVLVIGNPDLERQYATQLARG